MHGATDLAEYQQYDAHDEQDDSNRVEDGDPENDTEQEENNTEDYHVSGVPALVHLQTSLATNGFRLLLHRLAQ